MNRISVLLADHHVLLRETLRLFLHTQPNLEVVAEAGTAEEALHKAIPLCPDIILLEIAMPGGSGIAILPKLQKRCPESRVIVVTEHDEPSYLRAALAAGANGYVVKTSPIGVLMQAIHAVRRQETFVDPSLQDVTVEQSRPVRGPESTPYARLSDRERQVLKLLAQGLRYQDIAERMGISVKTVETYRSRLKAKLGFTNREDLMRMVVELGILSEGRPDPPA